MNIRKGLEIAALGLSLVGAAKTYADSSKFDHQEELPKIIFHAKAMGIEPELLMAVRATENGKKYPYGIIPTGKLKQRYETDSGYYFKGKFVRYESDLEKNMRWCAVTLRKRLNEFENLPTIRKASYVDSIDFIGDSYCPVGAKNDPKGLNKNWERNARRFYAQFKR